MGLAQYHAKRDFQKTPEPHGRAARRKQKALGYLIQKHAASHLHYDFRLELDGVLLSWAVPKGPSLDPADKRLAMHVEDHPLEYGAFEGTIPKGQYGGGTVMLWDRGTWSPVGDPHAGYRKGHLKFDLDGEKLEGRWALIRTHGGRYGGKAEAWLLVKDTDEFAKRGIDSRIVEAEPDSVVSGRSIETIAGAGDHEWHSNRSAMSNVRAGAVAKPAPSKSIRKEKVAKPPPVSMGPAGVQGARRLAQPAQVSPTLATLVDEPPQGDDWIHEIKYDGYRILARLAGGKVRLLSRNGKDWTDRFGGIAAQVKKIKASSAWLDGEVCAVDPKGRSSFQGLQNALNGSGKNDLVYFVFDLPYLDGYDLRGAALGERKRLLEKLLARTAVRYSPEIRGSGDEVHRQACTMSLEGIVSKRIDSTYAAGLRTRNWVKVKCSLRQEMVIGGFTDPQGSRSGFGALLLGVHENGKLRYAGKVGTGFDDKRLVEMRAKLDRLETDTSPFVNPPRGHEARGAHWVEPKLVAEVRFTEWSDGGALRHPSFLGLRADKKAAGVVREKTLDIDPPPQASRTRRSVKSKPGKMKVPPGGRKASGPANAAADTVAGVKLSNPGKPYFPEANLTKLSIARYYVAVADWILPHVEERPLSLVRCPDGWTGQCFYQKHADKSVHASVSRVQAPEGGGTATYFSANSLQALVGLLQWGVVELHPWGSRVPQPEKPDRLIFDFDPADDVPWEKLVEAVQMLRTLLDKIGLAGFLKTTGGKGLHVVVPVKRTLTWDQAKSFTKAIADLLARAFPDRFVATLSKSKRQGKIFIDYLRNAEGATAIAPYAIRARKNAPVSTPIAWKELARDVRFDYFNVKTVPARLSRLREDPWKDFASTRQAVTAAMFGQVGSGMKLK